MPTCCSCSYSDCDCRSGILDNDLRVCAEMCERLRPGGRVDAVHSRFVSNQGQCLNGCDFAFGIPEARFARCQPCCTFDPRRNLTVFDENNVLGTHRGRFIEFFYTDVGGGGVQEARERRRRIAEACRSAGGIFGAGGDSRDGCFMRRPRGCVPSTTCEPGCRVGARIANPIFGMEGVDNTPASALLCCCPSGEHYSCDRCDVCERLMERGRCATQSDCLDGDGIWNPTVNAWVFRELERLFEDGPCRRDQSFAGDWCTHGSCCHLGVCRDGVPRQACTLITRANGGESGFSCKKCGERGPQEPCNSACCYRDNEHPDSTVRCAMMSAAECEQRGGVLRAVGSCDESPCDCFDAIGRPAPRALTVDDVDPPHTQDELVVEAQPFNRCRKYFLPLVIERDEDAAQFMFRRRAHGNGDAVPVFCDAGGTHDTEEDAYDAGSVSPRDCRVHIGRDGDAYVRCSYQSESMN